MLRVKSFVFSNDGEMNELLSKYRLAPGAHILVSNGEIVIPYEDGEPLTKEQRIIALKEQKNTILAQMDVIEHSQRVLEFLIKDANTRLADADEAVANMKGASVEKDKAKEEAKGLRDQVKQLEAQKKQNDHELARYAVNVEMFDEKVDEIEAWG